MNATGYDDVKTIVVLGSEAALQKAQGTRSLIGADLDVIIGKDSAVVQSDVSETQAIPYSMADGVLIDFSVKGRCLSLHSAGVMLLVIVLFVMAAHTELLLNLASAFLCCAAAYYIQL